MRRDELLARGLPEQLPVPRPHRRAAKSGDERDRVDEVLDVLRDVDIQSCFLDRLLEAAELLELGLRGAFPSKRSDASATSPRWRAVRPYAIDATLRRRHAAFRGRQRVYASRESLGTAERLETAQNRKINHPQHDTSQNTSRRGDHACPASGTSYLDWHPSAIPPMK